MNSIDTMNCRIIKLSLLFCALSWMDNYCWSQTNISGTINTYTDVTLPGLCPNELTVSNSTGFSSGNTVIVIQMQGALADETNSAAFGSITAYNNAGLWEKAIVASVSGNLITFTKNLMNAYDLSGKIQVIKVPVYTDATVTSPLTANTWNGTTGGVIALEVSGTLLLNSSINANGIGFRGGATTQVCPNNCGAFTSESAYYYPLGNYRGGLKGEGIAPGILNKERGRGAQANGGGGGNDHNNGGGGGGNYANGGLGGNNNEPGSFNCKGGGFYGRSGNLLNYTSLTKVFFGGGGGAGHGNNGNTGGCSGSLSSGTGGNGGGIVIIIAGTINGNGQTIFASGTDGQTGWGDGGGGGGAGGVIFLSASSYVNNLTADVRGGRGGNSDNFTSNRCLGPGGGGASGIVISSSALPVNVTSLMTGGSPGVVQASTNGCSGSSTTATAGGSAAAVLTGATIPQNNSATIPGCALPVTFIMFNGRIIQEKVKLSWATATEYDASHFVIERSSDNFQFHEIGRVTAAGSTSSRSDYSFIDQTPYPGRNYYRLRQVDFTGREKLTHIISLDLRSNVLVQNFYPNPVKGGSELFLEFRDPEKIHSLKLLDISGRTIREWKKPGNNNNVERYLVPPVNGAVYLLEIRTDERKQVLRVVAE
jgi:hypothetical protein